MEENLITAVLLPLALGIIMLGMGLQLVPDDFTRIYKYPKAIAVGLLNQVILLPLIGFGCVLLFSLKAELAVGLMILAACPGGPTSNLITHLAKGDLALSVTLTAVATVICMVTIPFIINAVLIHFMPAGQIVTLPLGNTILSLITIAIAPVVLGMVIRKFAPSLAEKANQPVKILSAIFLMLIIVGAILKEKDHVVDYFRLAGPAALALNVFTLVIGYFSSTLFKLSHRQSITIAIEAGIQNGTLAIAIAATMLHNTTMTIPPAIYSLIMFLTAGVVIAVALHKKEKVTSAEPS